ncbi:YfiR family protein [Desulforhopalus vacuolatus]|uniref:YfiR family protein n=1 Tax=Desulforhopalus vacuolatus TaxID=40414 RepID=UPI00196661FE|nr:YfiR family protein [Desulforhopalus vacuolatus]MBM9520387.1 YfiR family protein [Desulforhopalus vacuolatus]
MKKDKELVKRLKRVYGLAVLLMLLSISAIANAVSPGMDEYAVKAAFVLNFARYTQWPEESFASPAEPFTLCVLGNKTIKSAFQELNGKKINDRTLDVHFMHKSKDVGQCDMMFIGKGVDPVLLLDILAAVKDKPVLTIGETKAFINDGGIINFFSRTGRLHFEINVIIARKNHLKLSSRLLKLAILVGEK